MPFLACGPYGPIYENEIAWIVFSLLVIKPLTYFVFIQAFRFRVNRNVPMSFLRAAALTLLRTLVGAVLVFGAAVVIGAVRRVTSDSTAPVVITDDPFIRVGWAFLFMERAGAWFLIGRYIAHLPGRRLLGWTLSGVSIDLIYDLGVVWLFAGVFWWAQMVSAIVLFAFLLVLHLIGRRDSLKMVFKREPLCDKCQYNLTGNLSGFCPECGERVPGSSHNRVQAIS